MDRIPVGCDIFRTCPDRPWGPRSLLYNGHRVFPGGKERPELDAEPLTPSSAVVKKEYSYTSTPPMGRPACTETQCLYKVALYYKQKRWEVMTKKGLEVMKKKRLLLTILRRRLNAISQ